MTGPGLFSGVRIVELALYVFVPGASTLLADQGAEVIKVEAVGTGDPYRQLQLGKGRDVGGANLSMEQNNRNKKSIALDLKSPEGMQAFHDLIRTADVFMSGLRPKALKSLRADVEDLRKINPKLIYARGNGYGFSGPEADKPGFDSSAFYARGGVAHVLTPPGRPMTPPRAAMGDHLGSLSLAYCMASALYHRAMTGEPSVVETSLLATAMWMLSGDVCYAQNDDYEVHNVEPYRFPLMSTYDTKDGRQIMLMLLDPQPHWPGLCRMLDLEELIEDPRYKNQASRAENRMELGTTLAARIKQRTWAEWRPLFEAFDAPWELVRLVGDVRDDPQVTANEMIFDTTLPGGQTVMLVAGPLTANGHPLAVTPRAAPKLGEHTDELLQSVGYSPEKIADLRARRAIQ